MFGSLSKDKTNPRSFALPCCQPAGVSAIITPVDYRIPGHQTDGYTIDTEVYTGPLDLLLQLIERAELDITRLALAQVTDQFLEHMHAMEEQNASEVSAFLVIAARLVQIKSAALLPRQSESEVPLEEDPGEALARQLIIYKRFKELGKFFEQREEDGIRTYLRLDTTPRVQLPLKLDLSELTLETFLEAAQEIFGSINLPPLSEVVSIPRITIREKIESIIRQIRETGELSFQRILSTDADRLEIVVTFLALLELVKRHIVNAEQNTLFGDIAVHPESAEFEVLEDADSEFGE
ncbi:segregation/condensation protein A [bacterium]|nr:segregation/condensation protein A [bacterium]